MVHQSDCGDLMVDTALPDKFSMIKQETGNENYTLHTDTSSGYNTDTSSSSGSCALLFQQDDCSNHESGNDPIVKTNFSCLGFNTFTKM